MRFRCPPRRPVPTRSVFIASAPLFFHRSFVIERLLGRLLEFLVNRPSAASDDRMSTSAVAVARWRYRRPARNASDIEGDLRIRRNFKPEILHQPAERVDRARRAPKALKLWPRDRYMGDPVAIAPTLILTMLSPMPTTEMKVDPILQFLVEEAHAAHASPSSPTLPRR